MSYGDYGETQRLRQSINRTRWAYVALAALLGLLVLILIFFVSTASTTGSMTGFLVLTIFVGAGMCACVIKARKHHAIYRRFIP